MQRALAIREFCNVLDGVVISMCFVVGLQSRDACGKLVVYRVRYIFLLANEAGPVGFELADEFEESLAFPDVLVILAELCLPR